MTERLADVSARIEGIRQLGAVVNAMKGIAAARARTARTQVDAADSYAATVASAISSVLVKDGTPDIETSSSDRGAGKIGLLIFLAEQGFAGAFSERVLDSLGDNIDLGNLFLIGTRGLSVATARGIVPVWTGAMPSHTPGIPKLADEITKAIYLAVDEGRIDILNVVHAGWKSGRPQVAHQALFPIKLDDFQSEATESPLTQLPADVLLSGLSADYIHALICKAALHAFAAENEARMEAMTAAGSQIARELEIFQATLRRVRQEAITAEIIELGTGAAAARNN
jgi:F-type H+-transporting ATPase subunit gamma